MIVIRFNTGRGYSPQGQRLTVVLQDDRTVAFADHDREVYGVLTESLHGDIVPFDDDSVARWVMRRYARCSYRDTPPPKPGSALSFDEGQEFPLIGHF